eukprot:4310326-Pyramimonas_sp.AAC.1
MEGISSTRARWCLQMARQSAHQSTIGVTEGAGGGPTRAISLAPLNAGELANRLYSNDKLWPGEDYDELLRKIRSNKTFVHGEACDRLCVASNGDA